MKKFFEASLIIGALTLSSAAFPQMKEMHKHSMEKGPEHDPHFLDMMTTHHKDGIKMAQLATERAESKEVKSMAQKILRDQKNELKQMQEWRQGKYSSAPKSKQITPKVDMSQLEEAKGADFDKNFAKMMAKHHEEGIKIAEEAIPMLENNQIKQFAQNTTKNQTIEMKQLKDLFSSLQKKTSTGTGAP